jgi:hypothetical protein
MIIMLSPYSKDSDVCNARMLTKQYIKPYLLHTTRQPMLAKQYIKPYLLHTTRQPMLAKQYIKPYLLHKTH